MKILRVDNCHALLDQGLLADGHELIDATRLSADEIAEQHADAQGFLVRARLSFPKEFLRLFPDLRFIARFGSGMEHIAVDWAEAQGIQCLSAPEGNRGAVGEHALAMLLSLFNRLHRADAEVRKGIWRREENRGEELSAKTVGIIGYGHMGSSFAQKLRGFGTRILVYDKYRSNFGHDWIEEVPLERLQQESDIISIHLPLNEETAGYLNGQFFRCLAKPVYLINTSRGNQLILSDLLDALKTGRVLGACLDVLEKESGSFEKVAWQENDPVMRELLASDKVIFSPHIAGWTFQSLDKMADVLLKKIRALTHS